MRTFNVIAIIVLLLAGAVFLFRSGTSGRKAEFSEEELDRFAEAKQTALERLLGPMHEMVGHAIVPFAVGGAVDMYYFPKAVTGTGFATMELIEPDGSGPKPNRTGTYELVAFTRHAVPRGKDRAETDPFNIIERRICGIFTAIGNYASEAVLNPGETCEIPGKEGEPATCLLFDEYAPEGKTFEINGKRHGLLLVIEVHRSEMEYAMKNGSAAVLAKLKEAGHYPYSDLDRKPVY